MQVSQHSNNQSKRNRAAGMVEPASTLFGAWTYRISDGTLAWTDSLFELFGFQVKEVVPTLSLMSSHQHPEDQATWDEQLQTIAGTGNTISVLHRVIDAHEHYRTIHTILSAKVDSDGAVLEVDGLMTDLTARLDQDRSRAAAEAVTRSVQSRGVIDQAKGVIMAIMNVEEQAAFDLLRWHSSHMNVKLRDVATAVVAHRAELTASGTTRSAPERLTAAITGLAATRTPALLPAPNRSDPAVDFDTDQEAARTSRIPLANLPATLLRAVAAAAQSISVADYNAPDQPLVYVNRAFERLTGYRAEEILGRNCRFLQGSVAAAEPEAAALASMRRAIAEGRESRTVVRNYRRNGTPFWNELHLSAVRDPAGAVTHYIGYQSDVSERVERDRQLEHLAFHDAITNLPNQAAAAAYLHRMLTSGDEGTADSPVLQVHLSGLHPAGRVDDPLAIRTVLASAAERLQAALEPSAYLAKLDDDAFLVVLRGASSLDRAARVLAEPINVEGGDARLEVRVERMQMTQVVALAQLTARP